MYHQFTDEQKARMKRAPKIVIHPGRRAEIQVKGGSVEVVAGPEVPGTDYVAAFRAALDKLTSAQRKKGILRESKSFFSDGVAVGDSGAVARARARAREC